MNFDDSLVYNPPVRLIMATAALELFEQSGVAIGTCDALQSRLVQDELGFPPVHASFLSRVSINPPIFCFFGDTDLNVCKVAVAAALILSEDTALIKLNSVYLF